MSEKRLPTVSGQDPDVVREPGAAREPDGPGPDGNASGDGATEAGPPDGAPVQVETSSVRLVGTLTVAGSLAGLAIVLVFQWANPLIEAWRAEVLSQAVTEVLAGAQRYETVFLEDDGFTIAPVGDTAALDRVYLGYDEDGRPVGVAMVGAQAGFQDIIRVIFGYDPGSGEVMGMQVLESKETPGLGDKIEKDSSFIREFHGVETPLVGRKEARATGSEDEVVMITGATISSQTIVDLINARVEEVGPQVEAFWRASAMLAATGGSGRTDSDVGDAASTTGGAPAPGSRSSGDGPAPAAPGGAP